MKKLLSILIVTLMLMQMFAFNVSSEEASYYAYWTGEGPGEIAFGLIDSSEYTINLYRNEKFVADTSHNFGDYRPTIGYHNFLEEIYTNGSGTYRAEVLYADGISATTDNYYYKKPSNSLAAIENLEFNQEKNYIVWNAVEGANLYTLEFCFSIDGGNSFFDMNSYLLDAEQDGTFFDFWGNPEDELRWIEESYEQAMINHGATADRFIRAIQVGAYPEDFNNANPSYSDYITFDGIIIPDDGDDNAGDGSYSYMEIVDYQNEYELGQDFYADLRLVIVSDDGTETYTIISSKDCIIEGFDPYIPGWQEVTIWHGDDFVTCDVFIRGEDAVPVYTVDFENVKFEYEYGEDFYIEVYRHNEYGEKISVGNDEWWVEGFDPYLPGWQTVTVFCENRVETYEVYVYDKETEPNYQIRFDNAQIEYAYGEDFYVEVYEITADGEENRVYDYRVDGFDPYTPGWQVVTVTYGDYSQVFKALVNEKEGEAGEFVYIKVGYFVDKYYPGDRFYAEVYGYTEDGICYQIEDYEYEGFDSYIPGEQIVTIWYGNLSTTVTVWVYGDEPGYQISIEQVKKQYYVGEEFSAVLTEVFEDGGWSYVHEFNVDGYDPYTLGEQIVTLSYMDWSETVNVFVKEKPELDENVSHIKIYKLETLYYLGDEFRADVFVYTKDGGCYMVEDYLYYDFDSSTPGEQIVTVRYGDFTDACTVWVYESELSETLSGSCGENLTWTLDTNGILTISGTGAMTNFESTNGMPWYDNSGRIKEVIIEDGVTSIGKHAFAWCYGLTNVIIPDSVTEIADYAFYACTTLPYIMIPDSATIGSFAFSSCERLENVEFGSNVTIGEWAFSSCKSLTNVNIHADTIMGDCVFRYCESLENINVDDSNPYYCSIDGNLFDKNKTTLIQYAIGKKDTSYVIPEGVTVIGEAAFDLCTNLTSITIPNSITSVYEFAFRGCKNLADVYYNGTASEFYAINVNGNNEPLYDATIHYVTTPDPEPAYSVTFENVKFEYEYGEEFYIEVYEYTAEGEKFALAGWTVDGFDSTRAGQQEVTVSFGDYSETYVVYVNETVEPSWWEYIPDTRELIIKGDMGSYGYNLNAGYTEAPWDYLRNEVEIITIWDGVTNITDGVFINFKNLREVNLGGTVNTIGASAFDGCTALEHIIIPDSVDYIAPRAFADCGLRTIDFGNGLTQIDSSAFQNCKFETVYLPESLKAIRTGAFAICRYLKEIHIPASVMKIESGAFNGCIALTDVYFGGTEEEWNNFDVANGSGPVLNVTIHCKNEGNITEYVSFENVKTEYEFGEDFYAEVWVTDIDGNRWQVENYEYHGFDPYISGWQTVTIRYDEHEENFDVFVREPVVVNVDFELLKTRYYLNEELNIRVYAHTSDGECNRVYDFEVEGFNANRIGEQNIIIRYGEFSQEFIIIVERRAVSGGGGGGNDGTGPVITVSQEKCRVGNTVDVVVSISENTGFTNLGLEIEYDRALRLVDVITNEDVGATFTPAQDYDVYPYNIDFTSTSNVYYDGELVKLVFEVPEDTQPGDYFVNVDFYKGRDGNYIDGESVNFDAEENPLNLRYESGYVTVYNYIPGDINGNGIVDNKDGTALLRYLAGWTLEQIDYNALDVDGDGTVGNKDGTRLLQYLAGWNVEVH